MNRSVIFSVVSLMLFLSGCTALRRSPEKHDLLSVGEETVADRLNANYGRLNSINGRFDFSYSTQSDRNSSWGSIYLNRSDTLYVEIKGLIGTNEAALFIDTDSLFARNYSSGLTIREKSNENSFRRVTGLDYDVSDMKSLFFVHDISGEFLKINSRNENNIVIRIIKDDQRHSFVTLDEQLLVVSSDEYRERELIARKEYDYYSLENGIYYPRRIRIRTFNPPSKLTVFFTRLNLNDPKTFLTGAEL